MKSILSLLLIFAPLFAQPTITGLTEDPTATGDSSTRLFFNSDVAPTAWRIRVKTAGADCDGTGGWTQNTTQFSSIDTGLVAIVSGLAVNTTSRLCLEATTDAYMTFSQGASTAINVTTTAYNPTPVAPTDVNTDIPTPSGTVYPVMSDCSDLQSVLDGMVKGDVAEIPAGTTCDTPVTLPTDETAHQFLTSDVTTSTGTVAWMGHGIMAGASIRVGAAVGSCLPGSKWYQTNNACDQSGGWHKSVVYYAGVPDADHVQVLDAPGGNPVLPGWVVATCSASADTITFTNDWRSNPYGIRVAASTTMPANTTFQLTATCGGISANTTYYLLSACTIDGNTACATQISLSSGGGAVDITSDDTTTLLDQGSGTMFIAPGPDPDGQYHTIRSDATCAPVGTRVTPATDADMVQMVQDTPITSTPVLGTEPLAFNWHITCINFTTGTNDDYMTTMDPRGYGYVIITYADSENIIFDRTRMTGHAYPQRFGGLSGVGTSLAGRNFALINSWWDEMNYWHPWTKGLASSVVAGTGRIASGSVGTGASIFGTKTASGNSDLTITGGTNGTAYVYFNMAGVLTAALPGGATGSWSCSAGLTCTTVTGTAFPTTTIGGSVRKTGCEIATFTYVALSVTAAADYTYNCFASANNGYGAAPIISGYGAGPYKYHNNFISGTGVPVHFTEDGGWWIPRENYTLTHNYFDVPQAYQLGSPTSNGTRADHRNTLEWKGGQKILLDGNIFVGQFTDNTNASVTLALTPRNGAQINDFKASNNRVIGGGGFSLPGTQESSPAYPPVPKRFLYENNLMQMDGNNYRTVPPFGGNGNGWCFYGAEFVEDVQFYNNTCWSVSGFNPQFAVWGGSARSAGSIFDSNVMMTLGGVDSTTGTPFKCGAGLCAGQVGKDAADIILKENNVASYSFTHNAYVATYTTTYPGLSTPSSGDFSLTTACNYLGGTYSAPNCNGSFDTDLLYVTGANAAARLAALEYTDPGLLVSSSFCLDPASPLIGAGSGGGNIGVDCEAMYNAQGVVRDIVLTPGTSSIELSATFPDTKAAYVTVDGGTTWQTISGVAGTRMATISGLTPDTMYTVSLVDYFNQTSALGFSGDQLTTQNVTTEISPRSSAIRGGYPRGAVIR